MVNSRTRNIFNAFLESHFLRKIGKFRKVCGGEKIAKTTVNHGAVNHAAALRKCYGASYRQTRRKSSLPAHFVMPETPKALIRDLSKRGLRTAKIPDSRK